MSYIPSFTPPKYDQVVVQDAVKGVFKKKKATIPHKLSDIAERVAAIQEILRKHCSGNTAFIEALEAEKKYLTQLVLSEEFIRTGIEQSRKRPKKKPD